jgi:hypothetical protein
MRARHEAEKDKASFMPSPTLLDIIGIAFRQKSFQEVYTLPFFTPNIL